MTINQGEDFELQIIIKDSNGTPINLTGNTYAGQIRSKYDSSTIIATFTITLGNQTTDPGLVYIRLSNTDTAAIVCDPATAKDPRPLTQFIYDIEETKAGKITRILEGIVSVSPNVTR